LSYSDVIAQTFQGIQEEYVGQKMEEVIQLLHDAEAMYRQKLAGYTLEQLLPDGETGFSSIDWIGLNK